MLKLKSNAESKIRSSRQQIEIPSFQINFEDKNPKLKLLKVTFQFKDLQIFKNSSVKLSKCDSISFSHSLSQTLICCFNSPK